ncbi:hypothetical protein [Tautonia plasticadhaerens]|uniref:hypothetical protein n=1 Tax=Tautonia plasticadhaerens TaxID=2527974 RepID=UPI0018D268D9|nr:hypothetical protein [Tautonia plasticadhaerens]
MLTLAAGIGVGVAVAFAADQDHRKAVEVPRLSQRDIIEKHDGKAASATVVEVTIEPGQKDSPHLHTGTRTRLLAVILRPRGTRETTVPEQGKESGSWLVTARCTTNSRRAVHENPPTWDRGGPESLAFEDARRAGDHNQAEQTGIPASP